MGSAEVVCWDPMAEGQPETLGGMLESIFVVEAQMTVNRTSVLDLLLLHRLRPFGPAKHPSLRQRTPPLSPPSLSEGASGSC